MTFFLSAAYHSGNGNSTIKSTVVHNDDGATDDDATNNGDDDGTNAGDSGGAVEDRAGGPGGGAMRLARGATMGGGATLCETTPDATLMSLGAPS